MKKKLLLFGVLVMSYSFIIAQQKEQQCTGNACSVLKIFQDSIQHQTIKNSSDRQVKVGVKWYFGTCREMIYYTLAPRETKSFNIDYFCPPYTAEFDNSPAPKPGNSALTYKNTTDSIEFAGLFANPVKRAVAPVFAH